MAPMRVLVKEARAWGKGVTPDPCGAPVSLRCPPRTGHNRLVRLSMSGSEELTIAGEKNTADLLKHH